MATEVALEGQIRQANDDGKSRDVLGVGESIAMQEVIRPACSGLRLSALRLVLRLIWMLGNVRARLSGTSEPPALVTVQEEETKTARSALKASEIRYRRLFETAQDGILILNAETGEIDDVNPFLSDLLGYSREQMLGNKLWEIGPFKDTKASKAAFKELQRLTCLRYEDLPLETKSGKSINVEFVSNVYRANGGQVIQCNIRDITERKQAELAHNENSRKLQVLSRRLVEAQESERRHLARELHDELGQTLTVAQLNLQSLLQAGNCGDVPRLQASLEAVECVLEQVHDLALNLRPSILDDLGLEPALTWLTNRQSELGGFKCEFNTEELPSRLDSLLETECYRIVQESLTNVMRHARANAVTVDLRRDGEQLCLRIRDNGIGFDVPVTREKAVLGTSLGLLSMEERAALAGGHFKVNSSPGQGTEVHACFPLKWRTRLSESKTT